ncbi:MAG: YicC/YloC family endoribonuclease [Phycisphaerales bacterium]
MTGFGDASAQEGGASYFLEVRSLNNRYFKATIRLPEEFQGLEAELESQVRRRLSRGSVTVIAICNEASAEGAHIINHAVLGHYIEQLNKTPQVASGKVVVEIAPLLGLPGVLSPPANEEARIERARGAYTKLLERACEKLAAMREREGKALLEDLLAQREVIVERLKIIQARAPQCVQDYELRLKNRIQMMLQDAQLRANEVDLIREIAVYAERSDISEEITRLSGHMEQYTRLLTATDGPVGRTLDFLAQEMLREANTMASKSGDAALSRAIVEIKGAIDRIKEQVQNVE